ncbi:defensin-like protein 1 [Quercus suber]|uniref:defensin-like protein 1 n=1 Tax=Quercus suber TaxID=58331 RepID=UPI000CE283A1|nr:defensin-like protein 1 [Quercus suber]
MERKSLGPFMLLFILLASQEMVVPTEARLCESKSHRFHGACFSHHNCAMVCRNEGFPGGKCRGFRRRCFCTRNC